jgi:hypothetical protein
MVVSAASHMLGMVRDEMPGNLNVTDMDKDLTRFSPEDILQHMGQVGLLRRH